MRAFAMSDFGTTPEVTDVPIPEPEAGEVRVRVRAASVNGFDLAVPTGYLNDYFPYQFPLVIGKDFAGEVDAVAPDVTDYAPGDRVFGVLTKSFLREGSYAEYLTSPTSVGMARLPEGVSYVDGAALGLAGTAARDVITAAALEPGQTLLVIGATGGVGNQVLQHAVAAGARVVATAHSAEEQELVTQLGAETVVDHAEEDVVARTRELFPDGVDVIAHLAGTPDSVDALRPGGRFVSPLVVDPAQVPSDSVVIVPIAADPTPEKLAAIAADHASGGTSLAVHQVFKLEQATDAWATFVGGTRGKVVIRID